MFEKILVKAVRIYLYIVGSLLVLTFCIVGFILLLEYSGEPSGSRYKQRLENLTGTELSSCRIIKKKYSEDAYYGAIFKLSREDFDKVLHAVEADTSFIYKPDMKFDSFTLKMLRQKNIDTALVNYKYIIPDYDNNLFFLEKQRMIVMEGQKIN